MEPARYSPPTNRPTQGARNGTETTNVSNALSDLPLMPKESASLSQISVELGAKQLEPVNLATEDTSSMLIANASETLLLSLQLRTLNVKLGMTMSVFHAPSELFSTLMESVYQSAITAILGILLTETVSLATQDLS